MTAVTRPRGPLPSRVYWTRRFVVLALLVGLVAGVAHLLGWRAGGGEESAASVLTAQRERTRPAQPAPSSAGGSSAAGGTAGQGETAGASGNTGQGASTGQEPARKKALPRPDGPCLDSDVLVEPVVRDAHVGGPVRIVLKIRTRQAEACTWLAGPDTVFLTISSEDTTLWSTQHCPAALPTEEVVARRTKPARVVVRWDGRESAPGCPEATHWVEAGSYATASVARGSVHPTTGELVLQEPPPRPAPSRAGQT